MAFDVGDIRRREQPERRTGAQPDKRDCVDLAMLTQEACRGFDVFLPGLKSRRKRVISLGVTSSMVVEADHVQTLLGKRLGELSPTSVSSDGLVAERAAHDDATLTRAMVQPSRNTP